MKSIMVAGLGFGDEGKGQSVHTFAHLSGIKNIIRYNGGPQALHHVIDTYGKVHCFSQFGSSTLIDNTQTILSKYMLIEPYDMENEYNVLKSKGFKNLDNRLIIDNDCVIITPMHKLVGQMREILRRKGSCGIGFGEAVVDMESGSSIRVGDIFSENIYRKLGVLRKNKRDVSEIILECDKTNNLLLERYKMLLDIDTDKLVCDYRNILSKFIICDTSQYYNIPSIYEGTQGVLLDRVCGFTPHITKSRTTFNNALKLCKTDYVKVGIIRPYLTRHGNGPFPTENDLLDEIIPDNHNGFNVWQGKFRIGWQDLMLLRYSINCIGNLDYVVMTNIDRLDKLNKIYISTSYEYTGKDNVEDFFEYDIKNGKYIISSFKKDIDYKHFGMTRILGNCKPVYTMFNDKEKYLNFLSSEDGIDMPIRILPFLDKITDNEFGM